MPHDKIDSSFTCMHRRTSEVGTTNGQQVLRTKQGTNEFARRPSQITKKCTKIWKALSPRVQKMFIA